MAHEEGSELDRELVEGVPDELTIEIQVKDGIAWDDRLDASKIHVDVCAGAVTLSGEVRTQEEKDLAESIAWGVEGVTDVANDLRVTGRERRGQAA